MKRTFRLTENLGVVLNEDFFKRNTDIVFLDLSHGNLFSISPVIVLLKDLESLDISNTHINDLPIEIGSLPKLTDLICDGADIVQNPIFKFINFKEKNSLLHAYQEAMKEFPPLEPFAYQQFNQMPPSFSLLSWNILADHSVRHQYYPLCQDKYLKSEFREEMITRKLLELKPNIICLQEFEERLCSNGFLKPFIDNSYFWQYSPKGRYAGKPQSEKGRVPGQLTMFDINVFELVSANVIELRKSPLVKSEYHTVCFCDDVVIYTLLKTKKDPQVFVLVINVHMFFQSSEIRKIFASAIMKEGIHFASPFAKNFEIIVAGDFNETIFSKQIGVFTKEDTRLRSVYDEKKYNPLTCNMVSFPLERIDHILATRKLKIASLLKGYSMKEIKEKCPVIPSKCFPSDHFPVGAIFSI